MKARITWTVSSYTTNCRLVNKCHHTSLPAHPTHTPICSFMQRIDIGSANLHCLLFLVPCEDFGMFVEADNSNHSAYEDPSTCVNTGHGQNCSFACVNGFELSNNKKSGTYICDPNTNPSPSWRHSNTREDMTAKCFPSTHCNAPLTG